LANEGDTPDIISAIVPAM